MAKKQADMYQVSERMGRAIDTSNSEGRREAAEYNEQLRKDGIAAEVIMDGPNAGNMGFRTRKGRSDYMKREGLMDKDAGFRDHAGYNR